LTSVWSDEKRELILEIMLLPLGFASPLFLY
jgi:hypothetical protein